MLEAAPAADTDIYECLLRSRSCHDPAPDPRLEAEVLRYSGLPAIIATAFERRPLVLFRGVATPNREMIRFLRLARIAHRPPLVVTVSQDRFTPAVNPTKRRLAKLPVATLHSGIRYVNVISFQEMDGFRFTEMCCLDGTPFLDFHIELMDGTINPQFRPETVDLTRFLGEPGSREYYPRFLALFTCFGVLAESLARYGYERSFTDEVILPAIEHVIVRFGKAPRIVRLLPVGEELDAAWEHYPNSVMERAMLAAQRTPKNGTPNP